VLIVDSLCTKIVINIQIHLTKLTQQTANVYVLAMKQDRARSSSTDKDRGGIVYLAMIVNALAQTIQDRTIEPSPVLRLVSFGRIHPHVLAVWAVWLSVARTAWVIAGVSAILGLPIDILKD
jgi:hypothetical protein